MMNTIVYFLSFSYFPDFFKVSSKQEKLATEERLFYIINIHIEKAKDQEEIPAGYQIILEFQMK